MTPHLIDRKRPSYTMMVKVIGKVVLELRWTCQNWTHTNSLHVHIWVVRGEVWLWEMTPNTLVFKRDRSVWSKHVNHFRLNNQDDCVCVGGVYDYLTSTRVSTLIMNNISMWALKIMQQMATCTIWVCWSSCTKRAFYILREVNAKRKSIQLKHLYLT